MNHQQKIVLLNRHQHYVLTILIRAVVILILDIKFYILKIKKRNNQYR